MLRTSVLPALSAGFLSIALQAEARNTFDDFTKAPTFDPLSDCAPTETHYGVMAQCEIKLSDGRVFWASMNTSVGWFKKRTPEDAKEFVRDHVAEAKAWWRDAYPKSTFTSEESPIRPKGAPPTGIECFRYRVQFDGVPDSEQADVLLSTRMEGLTCAWHVENPKVGKPTIELFWLEAFDVFTDKQKPLPNFQELARKILNSTRI